MDVKDETRGYFWYMEVDIRVKWDKREFEEESLGECIMAAFLCKEVIDTNVAIVAVREIMSIIDELKELGL